MTISNEKGVKRLIGQALTEHGWKHWPITQTAYGVSGLSDRIAIKRGVFLAVEAKFKYGRPTEAQKYFLRTVREQDCLAVVVSEKTIDVFRNFLDAFDLATEAQMRNEDADEKTKTCLTQSMALLIKPFMEE